MKHHPENKHAPRAGHASRAWRRSAGKNEPAKTADMTPEPTPDDVYPGEEAAHGMTDEPSPERLRSSENPSLLW